MKDFLTVAIFLIGVVLFVLSIRQIVLAGNALWLRHKEKRLNDEAGQDQKDVKK